MILAAFAGLALIRWQGMQALGRLRASARRGADPVGPIAHGALIFVAGMLLLVPGFFTDALGLLLLVPAVRHRLIRWGAVAGHGAGTGFARRARGARAPRPR